MAAGFVAKIATVIRIEPPRTVLLWWDGSIHKDLLTFDEKGYTLISDSLGGGIRLQSDVVRENIKVFLNDLLAVTKYDFTTQSPIVLNEARVKTLLGIK
jgi:hypothetical protein